MIRSVTTPAAPKRTTSTPSAKPATPSTNGRELSTFQAAPVSASAAAASLSPVDKTLLLTALHATPVIDTSSAVHDAAVHAAPANPFAAWITQTYETLLRRAPTAAEMTSATQWIGKELGAGKNIFQAAAEIVFFIKIGHEYKADHPMLSWINDLYSDRLGRAPTDTEVDQAEDLMKTFARQGKNFFQCCQGLDFCISIGAEHQAYVKAHPFAQFISDTFHKALGRAATPEQRQAFEKAIADNIAHGGNWMSACANVTTFIQHTPEYFQKHPFAKWLQGEFQTTLGRDPNVDEVNSCEGAMGKYMSQGHNIFQAGQLIDFLIKSGAEYKSKHPSVGPVTTGPSGGTRAQILAVAESQIGTLEYNGNNTGPCTKYPGYFGRGVESWCADFASWVMTHAGVPMNDPYCPSIVNTLKHDGRWKGRSNPQPGDLVLFDWNGDGVADHVGIVKGVNSNGTIETIEGNSDKPGTSQSGVWEHTRSMGTIMGFGNPT